MGFFLFNYSYSIFMVAFSNIRSEFLSYVFVSNFLKFAF